MQELTAFGLIQKVWLMRLRLFQPIKSKTTKKFDDFEQIGHFSKLYSPMTIKSFSALFCYNESMNDLIKHKLELLPNNPGCYLHKDKFGNIIYVGKAKNLKNRVRSYFRGSMIPRQSFWYLRLQILNLS